MKRALSQQSLAIYQELEKSSSMTAKELGLKLGIFPQAAYRAIKPLRDLGVVEEIGRYPRKYQVRASKDSLATYLKTMQEQYIKTFLSESPKENNPLSQLLKIEFIQDRKTLLQKHIEDLSNATYQVDTIVSGEEVPAEMILARKKALEKGIKLRFIVQQIDEFNSYMFTNWKKMGIEVKYFPTMEARIIIIDSKIVYITSYNPKSNEEAIGVRFDHPPIAKLMQELFEKRWEKAQEV